MTLTTLSLARSRIHSLMCSLRRSYCRFQVLEPNRQPACHLVTHARLCVASNIPYIRFMLAHMRSYITKCINYCTYYFEQIM